MSENRQIVDAEHRKQLANLFEGVKGRQPTTDDELISWLTSAEGQLATTFEPASIDRWGAIGRA
jgi:hypothetical protein